MRDHRKQAGAANDITDEAGTMKPPTASKRLILLAHSSSQASPDPATT